jgi:hypothetical protein
MPSRFLCLPYGQGHARRRPACPEFCPRYPWYLKLDIRKYFDSIPHAPLLRLLERRIKDKAVLRLIAAIVGTHDSAGTGVAAAVPPGGGEPDGAEAVPPASGSMEGRPPCRPIVTTGRGLPIGNLLSQHLANLYLGHLDHWIKETLRVRGYVRYMDDFVLWAEDKHPARILEGDPGISGGGTETGTEKQCPVEPQWQRIALPGVPGFSALFDAWSAGPEAFRPAIAGI